MLGPRVVEDRAHHPPESRPTPGGGEDADDHGRADTRARVVGHPAEHEEDHDEPDDGEREREREREEERCLFFRCDFFEDSFFDDFFFAS